MKLPRGRQPGSMVDKRSARVTRWLVRDVAQEWFEQALVETVTGVEELAGSQEWTVEHIKRALSEEALTAAVMQRYHVDVAMKRALGAKLGSLRDKTAGARTAG